MWRDPAIKLGERKLALQAVTVLTIANPGLQRRQKIKRNVSGLKFRGVGVSDVVGERPESGSARRSRELCAAYQAGGMNASHQPGGDGFDVTFHAADLPGEKNVGMRLHLQSWGEKRGSVDVGVAMDLPVAQKAGVFEPRNQPQDARLLSEPQMILKSNEIVGISA